MTKTYGTTTDGVEITDELVERYTEEAEAGYDPVELKPRMKMGRPPMGSAPAAILPVRLDPELRRALVERAEATGVNQSEVVREALRHYLAS